jgi:hypothetical protein
MRRAVFTRILTSVLPSVFRPFATQTPIASAAPASIGDVRTGACCKAVVISNDNFPLIGPQIGSKPIEIDLCFPNLSPGEKEPLFWGKSSDLLILLFT